MKKISVVIPCYNEQESIPFFYQEITKISKEMEQLEFEFVFINDGSKDRTVQIIKELSNLDNRVEYISFSRNFGKEAAIFAGLKHSTGDFIAIMDADLQDPPELIKEMYELLTDDQLDCVCTRRINRKGEPIIRSILSKLFYKIINQISETPVIDGARDFRLMRRVMVDAILQVTEYNRFSKGIFSWVGFNTKWLEYKNRERVAGVTKWSFWKLFLYSLDGLTAFSSKPLASASIMGLFFCLVSFVLMCVFLVKTLIWGDPVAGYPSLIVIILFLSGIQLFSIGVLGQYLSKTYLETKKRPLYIVRESSNNNRDNSDNKI